MIVMCLDIFSGFDVSDNELSGSVPPIPDLGSSGINDNCYTTTTDHNAACDVPVDEKAALASLYSPVPTGDPCYNSWVGVSCSIGVPSHVTSLDLSGKGLSGTVPSEISGLRALVYVVPGVCTIG